MIIFVFFLFLFLFSLCIEKNANSRRRTGATRASGPLHPLPLSHSGLEMRRGTDDIRTGSHHTTTHLVSVRVQCSLQEHSPARKHPRLTPRHSVAQLVQVVFLLSFGARGWRGRDGHTTAIEHWHDDLGMHFRRTLVQILLTRNERARVDRVGLPVAVWNLLHMDLIEHNPDAHA